MRAEGRGRTELATRLAAIAGLLRQGRGSSGLDDEAAVALLVEIERCRELAEAAATAGAPSCADPEPLLLPEADEGSLPANDGGDPRITRALVALRRRLGAAWTVAALARIAGMSRAAFARLFVATVGSPPLRHLATMRMREAARLLIETDEGLAAIAGRLGYASEFALSRAFKRHTGVAPAIHRRLERERRRRGSGPPGIAVGTRLRAVA